MLLQLCLVCSIQCKLEFCLLFFAFFLFLFAIKYITFYFYLVTFTIYVDSSLLAFSLLARKMSIITYKYTHIFYMYVFTWSKKKILVMSMCKIFGSIALVCYFLCSFLSFENLKNSFDSCLYLIYITQGCLCSTKFPEFQRFQTNQIKKFLDFSFIVHFSGTFVISMSIKNFKKIKYNCTKSQFKFSRKKV